MRNFHFSFHFFIRLPNHFRSGPAVRGAASDPDAPRPLRPAGPRPRADQEGPRRPPGLAGHETSLFSRLVLDCIETKFCNKYAFVQVFRDLQNYLADFLKKLQKFAKNRKILQNCCEISGFLKKKTLKKC